MHAHPHFRATVKYFSNSFVFKTEIEKEGLPRDSPAGLGAGGPEFKSRPPDQIYFVCSPLLREPYIFVTVLVDFSQAGGRFLQIIQSP
jgi:hypothetical protein